MNTREITKLAVDILREYYNKNPMRCLDYVDEDSIWCGPLQALVIKGKKNMRDAWASQKNPLTYTLGGIHVQCIPSNSTCCEVIIVYSLTTHYPNGRHISTMQRTHFTFVDRLVADGTGKTRREPRIVFFSVSILITPYLEDGVFPINFDQQYMKALTHSPHMIAGRRMKFSAFDKSTIYFISDSVLWIETSRNAQHSVIHALDGEIEIIDTLSSIEKTYPGLFLRPHISYLVNPYYVKSIRRFTLTLSDGTELPVPEKKYTVIKNQLALSDLDKIDNGREDHLKPS